MVPFPYIKLALNTTMVFLLILIAMLVLQTWFYAQNQARIYDRNIVQAAEEVKGIHASQQAALDTYRWTDANKTTVAIPIGRAMERIAAEANPVE
ncbi:MAG: hypothetical protein RBU29_02215 [bacterium]|jgi:hypothetical protein|nr:hypothetical protein [bacterium]